MRYYAGLDAGGTKTHVIIADETGAVLGFGAAGPGNYEVAGVEAARIEIDRAFQEALRGVRLSLHDLSVVGMGVAGADLPEDYDMLERELFGPYFGPVRHLLKNDSFAGLRGGTLHPFGIVIACGTGCVCAGVNRSGMDARVGGISEEFGDMVSGSSIGMEGIKAVWRARDGIIPPTLLTDLFLQKAGCPDVDTFFLQMYRRKLTYEALMPMAKLVFDAALEGDAVACDILEWGGQYLGKMVCAVARKLDMVHDTFEVVMAGSVFKGSSPVLKDRMTTEIHRQCPYAKPVMPVFEPVVGALLLGMEVEQPITQEIYTRLAETCRALERERGVRLVNQFP